MPTNEFDPIAIDPAAGEEASVWRSWAEHAPPQVLEDFNKKCLPVMKGIRSQYPGKMHKSDASYRNMRRAMIHALNRLAEEMQSCQDLEHGEDDAID
jgi:uncharacterized membrane protein YccC